MSIRSDHRPLVVAGFVTEDDDREPADSVAELLAEVGLPRPRRARGARRVRRCRSGPRRGVREEL